ncbi:MAG: hypothetical protein IPH85_05155 [Ignavibacteria bacterium]|nr:hypothetical protein [Ignavibacteria bacterium]MBP6509091.1 hypothetical protein [Candidatus Kapabacteria bacterium]MBK6419084.1 hypothetical protein [Ignavibacteria bacterium]MBK6760230.1 hypothetical protein [Ignavibacteria bacterium]MBK7034029.1 hypothetical protein [Ignavibacteria bacterium]
MMKPIILGLLTVLSTATVLAQSVETFNTIRLEDETTGNLLELTTSGLANSYTLNLPPAPLLSGPVNTGLFVNRFTQSMAFAPVPNLGMLPQQVAYLDSDGFTLRGTNSFTWDTVANRMSLIKSAPGSVLSISRTTPSSQPVATFVGGSVGIGTASPTTALDVKGDFSIRELNYTAALALSTNNMDFGNGNKAGMVRIGSTTTQDVAITGLVGGRNGKLIQLYNATGFNIVIVNESSASTDTCRFKTSETGDLSIRPKGTSTFIYSAAEQRWIMTSNVNSSTIGFTSGTASTSPGNTTVETNNSAFVYLTNTIPLIGTPPRYADAIPNVFLTNGRVVGQILAIEYAGPEPVFLGGPNVLNCNKHDKQADMFIWSGTRWICYGH